VGNLNEGILMTSKTLWRYRSDHPERQAELEEIAAEGRIWCPAAKTFNDPFDLNPVFLHSNIPISEQVRRVRRMIKNLGRDEGEYEEPMNRAREGYMNTEEYRATMEAGLRQELSEMPILCFYPDWSSLPMWAHYAGSASGFAVGIKFLEPWDDKYYPMPVKYSNDRPIVDLAEDMTEDDEIRIRHMEQIFLTKSTVWHQEEEERVIFYGREEGHYQVDPQSVVEICFGFNAQAELIERAIRISEERGGNLVVSQVHLSDRTYSLERNILA